MNDIEKSFAFRPVDPQSAPEAETIIEIERICFPPHEACTPKQLRDRIAAVPELFILAEERASGNIAGFLCGIETAEPCFRDEFFEDAALHDPLGGTVMLLGLDVLPEYRHRGLATALMAHYIRMAGETGRERLVLTCLEDKLAMYTAMGYRDLGPSASKWGGEQWHEMEYVL